MQERDAAAELDYLDVAVGGRLIEWIEVGGAVHEADIFPMRSPKKCGGPGKLIALPISAPGRPVQKARERGANANSPFRFQPGPPPCIFRPCRGCRLIKGGTR